MKVDYALTRNHHAAGTGPVLVMSYPRAGTGPVLVMNYPRAGCLPSLRLGCRLRWGEGAGEGNTFTVCIAMCCGPLWWHHMLAEQQLPARGWCSC